MYWPTNVWVKVSLLSHVPKSVAAHGVAARTGAARVAARAARVVIAAGGGRRHGIHILVVATWRGRRFDGTRMLVVAVVMMMVVIVRRRRRRGGAMVVAARWVVVMSVSRMAAASLLLQWQLASVVAVAVLGRGAATAATTQMVMVMMVMVVLGRARGQRGTRFARDAQRWGNEQVGRGQTQVLVDWVVRVFGPLNQREKCVVFNCAL